MRVRLDRSWDVKKHWILGLAGLVGVGGLAALVPPGGDAARAGPEGLEHARTCLTCRSQNRYAAWQQGVPWPSDLGDRRVGWIAANAAHPSQPDVRRLRLAVERFEGERTAVLSTDDGIRLDWPRAYLPIAVQAGDVVAVSIAPDELATRARRDRRAREIGPAGAPR